MISGVFGKAFCGQSRGPRFLVCHPISALSKLAGSGPELKRDRRDSRGYNVLGWHVAITRYSPPLLMDARGWGRDPRIGEIKIGLDRITPNVHAKELCRLFETEVWRSAKRILRPSGTRYKIITIVENVAREIEALQLGAAPPLDLTPQNRILQRGLQDLADLYVRLLISPCF